MHVPVRGSLCEKGADTFEDYFVLGVGEMTVQDKRIKLHSG